MYENGTRNATLQNRATHFSFFRHHRPFTKGTRATERSNATKGIMLQRGSDIFTAWCTASWADTKGEDPAVSKMAYGSALRDRRIVFTFHQDYEWEICFSLYQSLAHMIIIYLSPFQSYIIVWDLCFLKARTYTACYPIDYKLCLKYHIWYICENIDSMQKPRLDRAAGVIKR